MNGDGKLDLVVAATNGGVSVLLGNGLGTFAPATTFAAGPSPIAVLAADLNGDGQPDLVVADNGGGVAVLLDTTRPHVTGIAASPRQRHAPSGPERDPHRFAGPGCLGLPGRADPDV